MSPLENQLQQLRDRYGAVETLLLASGAVLVTVREFSLPEGWSKQRTSIRFLVPSGYPYAALDCFWADEDLRLASAVIPQNAGIANPIPEVGAHGLWFSWHLAQPWNANRDTLSSWMNSVSDRLRRVQ